MLEVPFEAHERRVEYRPVGSNGPEADPFVVLHLIVCDAIIEHRKAVALEKYDMDLGPRNCRFLLP